MKSIMFVIMSTIGLSSFAQSSICSTGSTISSGGYEIDYSLGIVSSVILRNDSVEICPGVIQPGSKSGTGITLVDNEEPFFIFPNPSSGTIQISGTNRAMNVSILNSLGQVIETRSTNSNSPIDISHLANGVFTLITNNQSFKLLKTN